MLLVFIFRSANSYLNSEVVQVKRESLSLYREYILGLELAGFLLMAGIVGAAHIGKHKKKHLHRYLQEDQASAESLPDLPEQEQLKQNQKEKVPVF